MIWITLFLSIWAKLIEDNIGVSVTLLLSGKPVNLKMQSGAGAVRRTSHGLQFSDLRAGAINPVFPPAFLL